MAADNTVTLVGNLTRDPELRFTPNGAAVAEFGLAWNRRWQKDGEWQEEPHFFDITCWNDLAENVTDSLAKGDRVVVVARADFRSWETDDGDKRSKVRFVADDVSPSLRWATIDKIRKVNRREDDGGGSRGGGRGGRDSGRGRGRDDDDRGRSSRDSGRGRSARDEEFEEEPF